MSKHNGDDGGYREIDFSAFTFSTDTTDAADSADATDDGLAGERASADEVLAEIFPRIMLNGHRLASDLADELAAEGRPSVTGLLILHLLATPGGPRTPTELAEAMGCSRSAISHSLRRLEDAELVDVEKPRDDLRTRRVEANELGELEAVDVKRTFADWTRALDERFTEQQCRELHSLLVRFEQVLDRRQEQREGKGPLYRSERPAIRRH